MPSNERDGLFEVTLATEHLKSYKIRAAYLNVDERYFPGCIQFKTEAGTLAALVPFAGLLLIQRLDDPAAAGKPVPQVAPLPGGGSPSPATVAASTRVWSAPATSGGTP